MADRKQYRGPLRKLAFEQAFKRPLENQTELDKRVAGLLSPNQAGSGSLDLVATAAAQQFDLYRDHTMSPDDMPFDIIPCSPLTTVAGVLPAAVGGTFTWWNFVVPAGQRLVFNSICFFGIIDNTPVDPYPIFAAPLEFGGSFDFHIHVNGRSPIYAPWQATAVPAGIINAEGHPILNDRPQDIPPYYGGLRFQARGGETITLFIRRFQVGVIARVAICYGARLRGFMTMDKDPRMSKS